MTWSAERNFIAGTVGHCVYLGIASEDTVRQTFQSNSFDVATRIQEQWHELLPW